MGADDNAAFVIGQKLSTYTATKTGELCAFANDLNGDYSDNSGKLKIRVSLVKN